MLLPRTFSRSLSYSSSIAAMTFPPARGAFLTSASPRHPKNHPMRSSAQTMATSTSTSLRALPEWIVDAATNHPVASIGSIAGLVALLALLQYRGAIRKRLKLMREESWLFGAGVTMERIPTDEWRKDKTLITNSGLFANMALLELNPDFQQQATAEGWSLMTLGDYLSSLRPKQLPKKFSTDAIPKIIQREIEAGLGAALLKVLGPNLGIALLPAVGTGAIQKRAQALASSAAVKWFFDQGGEGEETSAAISASQDKGGIPLGFLTLLAGANLNAKFNSRAEPNKDIQQQQSANVSNFNLTAMEKMTAGEVVKGPSFVDPADTLVPQDNFCLEADFDRVIRRMESKLGAHPEHQKGHVASPEHQVALEVASKQAVQHNKDQTSTYDPEDTSMAAPVPINSRLFPDLHMGWGNAKCTHTKREVLKMRLISLLLNRLGANYQKMASGSKGGLYTVQMTPNGPKMTKPSELVQALMDSGHKIEVVPTSRLTTFGLALCVKEPNGQWTNVPLGVFLESGFEDEHGNASPAMMPHSGLDMYITGPLAGSRADGTPSTLRIQHFIGIEGFCGWKSHESPQVPFNEAVEQGARLTGSDAVRASRLAALYANALNGLATDLHLPFGGYGVTSVCNDSAAVVQHCLYGHNTIYPMTSIGKFAQRTMRYVQHFRQRLEDQQGLSSKDEEIQDLSALVYAMKQLPNDINSAPSNAESAARRMLRTIQPRLPFMLNVDSKQVMEAIITEEYAGKANHGDAQLREHVREKK
uniref:Uncharacterized protein n=1 Tax=Amphora coffeiformis TaxID=265554 RepID=A0A7S3L2K5_9STRA|mmetsp:Transcript_24818/g.47152  ORF Transcript_24818/g.47152 Transcript_24818/m.47152 type:complete len:759 (-) Transcript_24818:31-2307(-)